MASPVKKKKKESSSSLPVKWLDRSRLVFMVLFAVGFTLYTNSLSHGFVLDDSMLILKNEYTSKGISGIGDILSHDSFAGYYKEQADQIKITGGRYRPLSLIGFAILYQLSGDSPFLYHLWNVVCYALCCGFLFLVLKKIASGLMGKDEGILFAVCGAFLFAVHPIHTEVVNNIKSNDEILCLLLSLASLFLSLRFFETGKKSMAVYSAMALFLAFLAKENAIAFLAIIPLTWWLRRGATDKKISSSALLWITLGVAFVLYFGIRTSVLGGVMSETTLDLINNPFIKPEGGQWIPVSAHERLAMISLSLGKYLQLFLFPATLSSDYYPRYIPVTTLANPFALLSMLIYLIIAGFAVYSFFKGKRNLVTFGLLFFLLSLGMVSNIIFPIGTNLAERFLFMPSVGLCILAAFLFQYLVKRYPASKGMVYSLTGVIILIFSIRTFIRNGDFASNRILFAKDVLASPNSAKIQNGYGALIAEEALKTSDRNEKLALSQEALVHLDRAIEIHPGYLEAYYMRANVQFLLGKYDQAVNDYRQCLQLNPNFTAAYGNYALALREFARQIMEEDGDLRLAIQLLEESLKLYPNETDTQNLLQQARAGLPPG